MIDPLSLLGAGLGELVGGLVTSVLVAVGRRVRAGRRPREIEPAQVKRIVDEATAQLRELRRGQLAAVPDAAWRAALAAAGDSLRAAAPLGPAEALELDLRPELLEAHVRAAVASGGGAPRLDAAAQAAYDAILSVACEHAVRSVMTLPDFDDLLRLATFRDVREVRRVVAGAGGAPDAFERRYLDHLTSTQSSLELFGLGRGRAGRGHSLDTAYVSLALARSGHEVAVHDEDDEELTGAGIDVVNALADQRRVLVRGGAGAGKTTLLRWLAVTAARDALGEGGRWGGAVPFLVQLRALPGGAFPDPEALPALSARVITGEMPPGWASERLRAGRALLLVDGVDELPVGRRQEASQWLRQLTAAYGDASFVVTTRPFAVGDDWLAGAGFASFDLLPMSPEGVREYLGLWHAAAREAAGADAGLKRWLDESERGLTEVLATRPELRRLAANPLLCGLLCALYQDRNMHLPLDRKGLYDAALDLLLVRWDEQRGVRVDDAPLSKEEQVVLLQRFAYSLVKNQENVVSRDEAARRIAHAMRGLRSNDAEPEPILQHTLERTGLLREPNPDAVQFVHRTFRDYLAAKEVVEAGDLKLLIEQAHLDQWHDVVVMAVAHARPRERDGLLRDLLRGNAAAQADQNIRHRLHLVAAACLEQAYVTGTDGIRRQVKEAAARLIPPARPDDAELLARAGSFVLELLPGPHGLTEQQAVGVVRTAAMIGGEGARDKLAQFVTVDESRVIDELLRAWRRAEDPEEYARTVLAEVDFGDRRLEVRGWHRIRCLRHLARLHVVACYGDFGSLGPLAAVPNLRRLELNGNELLRDLGPLARSRSLRALQLTGCPSVLDLSPLAATAIEELALYLMQADLGTLRGAPVTKLSIRDPRLRGGLGPLPADLPLRELTVDNLPTARSLLGIERWQSLTSVSVRGVPRDDEIGALAQLPALSRIVVRSPEAPGDLLQLGRLLSLRRLDLEDVPGRHAEAVAGLADRLPDVEVRHNGRTLSVSGR